MARAMQVPKARLSTSVRTPAQSNKSARAGASTRASASSRASKRQQTSRKVAVNRSEQRRAAPRPTVKKVTSRTSSDRQQAKISPLARAVNQKNAPKATRIFIYTTATLAVLTITLMMVVVVFQTRLAETQLNIDVIEKQISVERARYDELRLQRSALREPSRLVSEASALGMVPGAKTNFNTVDPSAVA